MTITSCRTKFYKEYLKLKKNLDDNFEIGIEVAFQ